MRKYITDLLLQEETNYMRITFLSIL